MFAMKLTTVTTLHASLVTCISNELHCSNRDSAPQSPRPKGPSRLGRKQRYRASRKVWIFSAELVTKVDKYPAPGFADDNICNSPLSASQSSDNEDGWEAMEAAAPSGGNCTVALDVDTAHRLAAAPASASVIADDQVGPDSNSSAGEYPHNFANLAPDFDSANPLATAPATPARTGPTADEIVPNSKSPSFDETYPQDFVELARDVLAAAATFPESAAPTGGLSDDIVCPSSAVGIDQLGELVAEATGVSREAAPDKQRKHRKNARKLVAVVGSSENPGMQREPRKAAKKPT